MFGTVNFIWWIRFLLLVRHSFMVTTALLRLQSLPLGTETLSSPSAMGLGSITVWLAFGDGMTANIKHTQMLRTHFCDLFFPSVPEIHQEQNREETCGVNLNTTQTMKPSPAALGQVLWTHSQPMSKEMSGIWYKPLTNAIRGISYLELWGWWVNQKLKILNIYSMYTLE